MKNYEILWLLLMLLLVFVGPVHLLEVTPCPNACSRDGQTLLCNGITNDDLIDLYKCVNTFKDIQIIDIRDPIKCDCSLLYLTNHHVNENLLVFAPVHCQPDTITACGFDHFKKKETADMVEIAGKMFEGQDKRLPIKIDKHIQDLVNKLDKVQDTKKRLQYIHAIFRSTKGSVGKLVNEQETTTPTWNPAPTPKLRIMKVMHIKYPPTTSPFLSVKNKNYQPSKHLFVYQPHNQQESYPLPVHIPHHALADDSNPFISIKSSQTTEHPKSHLEIPSYVHQPYNSEETYPVQVHVPHHAENYSVNDTDPMEMAQVVNMQLEPSNASDVQKSASNESIIQPSAFNESNIQLSAFNESNIQPSAFNESNIQPSAFNESIIQPSAFNESNIQPSVSNESIIQPSASNESNIQPSASNESKIVQTILTSEFQAGQPVTDEEGEYPSYNQQYPSDNPEYYEVLQKGNWDSVTSTKATTTESLAEEIRENDIRMKLIIFGSIIAFVVLVITVTLTIIDGGKSAGSGKPTHGDLDVESFKNQSLWKKFKKKVQVNYKRREKTGKNTTPVKLQRKFESQQRLVMQCSRDALESKLIETPGNDVAAVSGLTTAMPQQPPLQDKTVPHTTSPPSANHKTDKKLDKLHKMKPTRPVGQESLQPRLIYRNRDKNRQTQNAMNEEQPVLDKANPPQETSINIPEAEQQTELESSQQTVPKSSQQKGPESSQQTVPKSSQQTVPKSSQQTVPKSSQQTVPKSSQKKGPESSQQTVPKSSQKTVPKSSQQTVPKSSQQKEPKSSQQKEPENSQQKEPKSSQRTVSKSSQQTEPESSTSDPDVDSTQNSEVVDPHLLTNIKSDFCQMKPSSDTSVSLENDATSEPSDSQLEKDLFMQNLQEKEIEEKDLPTTSKQKRTTKTVMDTTFGTPVSSDGQSSKPIRGSTRVYQPKSSDLGRGGRLMGEGENKYFEVTCTFMDFQERELKRAKRKKKLARAQFLG